MTNRRIQYNSPRMPVMMQVDLEIKKKENHVRADQDSRFKTQEGGGHRDEI